MSDSTAARLGRAVFGQRHTATYTTIRRGVTRWTCSCGASGTERSFPDGDARQRFEDHKKYARR